jgi:16S rRNA (guanine527-N7)-methyltransferase
MTDEKVTFAPRFHVYSPADFARTFHVPHETVEKLQLYAEILRTWQKAVNLISSTTLEDIWHRHFADSAQLLDRADVHWRSAHMEAGRKKTWIDLGSGGGFPGLVIAILLSNRENHVVHLIESNSRKCAFLTEVARRTEANAVVHEKRVEDFVKNERPRKVDVIASRALAPLNTLLGLAQNLFSRETQGLFLKGRETNREIQEARHNWCFEYDCVPSRTSGEGRIIEVRNLARQI